jgi:hydrogenase maturation factor
VCVTFPARILAVDDGALVIDYTGRRRRVDRRLVPDVCPGEDVLVGLGQILARLTVDEATLMASDMASVTARPSRSPRDGPDPPYQEPDRSG